MYDIQNKINDKNALRKLDSVAGNLPCLQEKNIILINDDILTLDFPGGIFDFVTAIITAETNKPSTFGNLFVFTEDGSDPIRVSTSVIPNPNPNQIPDPNYQAYIVNVLNQGTHNFDGTNYLPAPVQNTGTHDFNGSIYVVNVLNQGTHVFDGLNYFTAPIVRTGTHDANPTAITMVDDPNDLTLTVGAPSHGALMNKGGIIEIKGLENINKFKFKLANQDNPTFDPNTDDLPTAYNWLNVKFYVNKVSQ